MAAISSQKLSAFDITDDEKYQTACRWCNKISKTNSKCGKCRVVFYCGRECQIAAWPSHKILCSPDDFDGLQSFLSNQDVLFAAARISFLMKTAMESCSTRYEVDFVIEGFRHSPDIAFDKIEGVIAHKSHTSGCSVIFGFIAFLCAKFPKMEITAEMFAAIMQLSMQYFIFCNPGKIHRVVLNSTPTPLSFRAASIQWPVLNSDTLPTNAIYLFNLNQKNSPRGESANHYFIVIRKNERSMIIQNFANHYTFIEWCAFNNPLLSIDTTLPCQKWPLNPAPRFRGILDNKQLNLLFADIERLTFDKENYQQIYADITGITLPVEIFPELFGVVFSVMFYDQVIRK